MIKKYISNEDKDPIDMSEVIIEQQPDDLNDETKQDILELYGMVESNENVDPISIHAVDIDNDGNIDLIGPYKDTADGSDSNFFVRNQGGLTLINLSDDKTKFTLASEYKTFKYNQASGTFTMVLKNIENGEVVELTIKVTYTKESNSTYIKLNSRLIE